MQSYYHSRLRESSLRSLVKTIWRALPLLGILIFTTSWLSPSYAEQTLAPARIMQAQASPEEPSIFVKESNKQGLPKQNQEENIPQLNSANKASVSNQELATEPGEVVDLAKQKEIALSLATQNSYVLDPEHYLSNNEALELKKKLYYFAQNHNAEIALVIISSTYGRDIFSLATELFDKLQPGVKGLDSGLLILLAIKDKKYQIVTGSGLEGLIPDALTAKIAKNNLVPYLRKNQLYLALDHTSNAFINLMEKEYHLDQPRWKDNGFRELKNNANKELFGDLGSDEDDFSIIEIGFIIVWGLVFCFILFGRFFFRRLRPFIPLRFSRWASHFDDDDDDSFRGGRGGGGGFSSRSSSSSRSWSAGGGRGFGGGRTSGGGSGGSW